MTVNRFLRALGDYRAEHVFNPYRDHCPSCDRHNAAQLRRGNLRRVLQACLANGVEDLWLGRDLGYLGGRRTGLALTGEDNFALAERRWGVSLRQATRGAGRAERTAACVWQLLPTIDAGVFMWNVFPFHPHPAGEPFGNRSHSAREREAGLEYLQALIDLLRPRRLVAIGNDAQASAGRLYGDQVVNVRHPSYGGKRIFERQIAELYRLGSKT